ncbi:MAG: ATP-binding protein [Vicinamibacteraceae bacterium]|nr:ATP-binding protein [Vicinamibacteraceae bacterium]
MSRWVEFRATATLAAVRTVAADVRAWCGARIDDVDACRDVELAVDEACTNIVRHAHPHDPSAIFHVRLDLAPGALRVTITDRAPRFAGEASVRTGGRDAAQGGLGLRLMRQTMHDIHWAHRGGVNVLRMTRRLGVTPGVASAGSTTSTSCPDPRGW